MPEPPIAAPAAAAAAAQSAGEGQSRIFESDEYQPGDTADLRRRTKALINRHEDLPKAPDVAIPPAPPVPSLPTAGKAVASPGRPAGDPFDPDLFDRMARESQGERAMLATVTEPAAGGQSPATPQGGRAAANVPSRPVSCPVCGHGFVSTTPDSDQQHCPQCHTAFNLARGNVVAGGPRAGGGDPLIGRIVRGCMIDRKVGEGGMGSVYHARQLSLDRSVAIKVLPPELARNKNFIQRFEREAKSLAKINHPNILHIYDFGEDHQVGFYFMIIEFVEGRDLGDMLQEHFTLGQVEVLDVLRQAALGLEQAAEKGVIHRDIKPDYLMLTKEGICKVSDFGLAKASSAEKEVTSAGVRVGTPAFMSPEQCDGIEVDFRSDIYNLGCTAFLALTGQLPYDADTPFAIMLKHKIDPVPSPRKYNPNHDQRVEALVMRMIQKDPADRFSTLREMIELIEDLEVKLAGTTNVLRKSRGPFRAMSDREASEHGRLTSQGNRPPSVTTPATSSPSAAMPPTGPGRGSSGSRLPVAAPAVPSAKGMKSPRPVGAVVSSGPIAVPDWLKPIEEPVQARKSSSNLIPPTMPAQPLGTASPSGFRDLRAKLAEARNRNLHEEAETLVSEGNRLAAAGDLDEAAGAWTRAASLIPDATRSQMLLRQAGKARKRGGLWRGVKLLLWLVVLAGLLAAGAFFGIPQGHRLLAERELTPITEIASPSARLQALDGFVTAWGRPLDLYAQVFRRSYVIEPVERAREMIEQIKRAPPPVPQPRLPPPLARLGEDEFRRLDALRGDASVPVIEVSARARELLGRAAHPDDRSRIQVLVDECAKELASISADVEALQSVWATGRQGEVAMLSATFRNRHPRAGSASPLALPGRIEVVDADGGRMIAPARIVTQAQAAPGTPGIFAGTGQLAPGENLIVRYAAVPVLIEVVAEGYRTERVVVAANPDAAEQVVRVALRPAPVWSVMIANAPRWLATERLDDQHLLVRCPETIVVVRSEDGVQLGGIDRAALPVSVPPAAAPASWTDFCERLGERAVVASTDGVAAQIALTPGRPPTYASLLHRGAAPVLAYSEKDMVFHAGKRMAVVVESSPQGLRAVARTADKDLWTRAGMKGFRAPLLWFIDDHVLLMDDHALIMLDELDGRELAVAALSGVRSGVPAVLGRNGVIAVPTSTGVVLVHVVGGAQPALTLLPDPLLGELGIASLASDGEQLVAIRPDKKVHLLAWQGERLARRWVGVLPPDAGVPTHCTLAAEQVLVADDQGSLFVLGRSDGQVLRRILHGTPLAAAPLVVDGKVLFADREGRVSAYRLTPR